LVDFWLIVFIRVHGFDRLFDTTLISIGRANIKDSEKREKSGLLMPLERGFGKSHESL
jgi:hypothetical protein